MKLDESLAESIVFVPDGIFEFIIPTGRELASCYAPGAFCGESHRFIVAEPTDSEIFDERLISLLKKHSSDTPRVIIDETFAEVERHADGADQSDDITVMCIKYC